MPQPSSPRARVCARQAGAGALPLWALPLWALLLWALLPGLPAFAQGFGASGGLADRPVSSVEIRLVNPSADPAVNDRVTDTVRRTMALFPGQSYSRERIGFAAGVARRNRDVGTVDHTAMPATDGGVDVVVEVTLADAATAAEGRGFFLTGDRRDLPILYDRGGTLLRVRFEALALTYSNTNAWYGRPDAMLAGNPLVEGNPAGRGFEPWLEGYLHYGLYGITPITPNLYLYGGISALTSGSVGQELFTDRTRTHTAIEDAYVGVVGGTTTARGDRLAFSLSAGRQRFTLANAFLIANTAANGNVRAALQANARWSSDLLVHGQLRWNGTLFEAFLVDPDELPVLDTGTRIAGVNVETADLAPGLMLGASWLTVPRSRQSYFSPAGTNLGTREGLRLWDLRATWRPGAQGRPGPFFGIEYARQTNRNFPMRAQAGYVEAGYDFADARFAPVVSWRLSYFSGDDAATERYERWDPLLSGGTGEQWVQGANHFKVVQNSNVIAHRLQARLRVAPKIEVVPQLWAFRAASTTNIGGNPALSLLSDREYGYEANVTVKWFASRNVYVHGHVAYTVPGKAVRDALGGDARDWWSAMLFVRYAL